MPSKKRSTTPYTDAQRKSGDWNPLWSTFSEWDPEFLEAYLRLRNVPFRKGPLPKKVKELILVAINAATTHLYAPGVRRHIRNALQHGATREEILEAIELTTVLGIHSSNVAVPILIEELAEQGRKGGAKKRAGKI
ncbi:MAG: carboxymuconolactone decarboxylase family protein [Candidatus Binataceae bacterium]|nr:carboxymuconolactone decarboxylase family protein [Candidatus Binataceae bacterium]